MSPRNSIFLVGFYRQWSVPGSPGSDLDSARMARLRQFLTHIDKIHDKEILIFSDTSINTEHINSDNNDKTDIIPSNNQHSHSDA